MYEYENILKAEQEINLPEDNLKNSHQMSFNDNSPLYNTVKVNPTNYLNNNSDSFYNYTSPRINKDNICYKKLNNVNVIPHHHHRHITHIHHHCHSPFLTNSMTKSRSCSRSCSCSPSPIKDISQPLINSNFKIQSESPNQTNKFIYRNDNTINTKANTAQNMNYDDNYKYNDYINNIYTQKINDNEINKNNNSFINNNEETNNLTAKAFDEYMS